MALTLLQALDLLAALGFLLRQGRDPLAQRIARPLAALLLVCAAVSVLFGLAGAWQLQLAAWLVAAAPLAVGGFHCLRRSVRGPEAPRSAAAPTPGRVADAELVRQRADAIEAELMALGWWQSEPLDPRKLQFRTAFAIDTMHFSQWLQFVLLPRVRSLLATNGPWPPASNLAGHAAREFDGEARADALIDRLRDFDALFR